MKDQFTGYIFTKIESDGTKVQVRIPDPNVTHTRLADEFTRFLRGSGYVFDPLAEYVLLSEDE